MMAAYNDGSNLPSGVYMVHMGGQGMVRSDTIYVGTNNGYGNYTKQTITAVQLVNKHAQGGGYTFERGFAYNDHDDTWEISSNRNFATATSPEPTGDKGG